MLESIASKSTKPELTYGTDEDCFGNSPRGIDPTATLLISAARRLSISANVWIWRRNSGGIFRRSSISKGNRFQTYRSSFTQRYQIFRGCARVFAISAECTQVALISAIAVEIALYGQKICSRSTQGTQFYRLHESVCRRRLYLLSRLAEPSRRWNAMEILKVASGADVSIIRFTRLSRAFQSSPLIHLYADVPTRVCDNLKSKRSRVNSR